MFILTKQIEMKVNAVRKMWYDSNSMWGAYSFEPIEPNSPVKLNSYGNFVVSGNTPELIIGNNYEIIIEPS